MATADVDFNVADVTSKIIKSPNLLVSTSKNYQTTDAALDYANDVFLKKQKIP